MGERCAEMMRMKTVAAVASATLACTIHAIPDDAGTTDAGSQTVGDQCSAIAAAFCTRAIGTCGVVQDLSTCIANEMPTCCTGSTCSAISQSSPGALEACKSAIAVEDCNLVVNAGPAGLSACNGIPKKP
jgi:hypothetical protein